MLVFPDKFRVDVKGNFFVEVEAFKNRQSVTAIKILFVSDADT
jgi:hypothetical protein